MEIWDIYDVDRQLTKKKMKRGEKILNGDYHLVVSICIFNSKGEMLIQQRQKDKMGWPSRWDISAAGSATAGETSKVAAQRELQEEIGLKADFENKRPIITVNFSRGFQDYYCFNMDVDLTTLKLQQEEVQAVKWANRETILKMIDSDEFIPYYKSLINSLFDMRDGNGSHSRIEES